ncbi:hypothetical protein FE88_08540 [Azospirillum brasilense]|nr:hypothetical protein AMK58_08225 [Azospirillum brasilense]OPH16593.1 hypothetical protein FE89_03515 [Azospirillum brasilense]OPH21244.1 hypothetical protein FE88_08540 [Azospirillum brasilense]PWC94643.1 hypothetical protein AEJ54_08810 [Azospirillum sp. Sp 7]
MIDTRRTYADERQVIQIFSATIEYTSEYWIIKLGKLDDQSVAREFRATPQDPHGLFEVMDDIEKEHTIERLGW